MPTYEYECPQCDKVFEVTKPMSKHGTPESCSECGVEGERRLSETGVILRGDGWPGKAGKVKGQMARRRAMLGQKEKDHAAPPLTLTPNVEGEVTDTWSDAQKLAADKGKNTESFEPLVEKEKRGVT